MFLFYGRAFVKFSSNVGFVITHVCIHSCVCMHVCIELYLFAISPDYESYLLLCSATVYATKRNKLWLHLSLNQLAGGIRIIILCCVLACHALSILNQALSRLG